MGLEGCVCVCVDEAAGWRVCKSGRGQTGNDEVIAKVKEKRKAGWEGGEPGGVTLIQR